MLQKKVITILLIQFVLTFSNPLLGLNDTHNNYSDQKPLSEGLNFDEQTNPNQRKLFQLLNQSINEEAKQELCPYPGYYGNFCAGSSAGQYNYLGMSSPQDILQGNIPNMPTGVGVSFDITTGELKLPAVQLTYSKEPTQEKIWRDPASGYQFVLADEMQVEQIQLQPDVKVYENEQDFSKVWLNAVFNGYWLGGQYSQSQDLGQLFEKYFRGNQQISVSQQAKNVVRMTFKTNDLKLNKFAQRALNALPQQYSPGIYNEFLNSWGTHLTVDTHLGGMMEKVSSFKSCTYASPSFTDGLSAQQIEQALQNELFGRQTDGYFVARRRIAIDHKFGGNPENVQNWENTISQNPALLKINRFLGWDHFVSDPQVKSNLQLAINNRIESMRQKYYSNLQQVEEQRRLAKCQPKTAYAIQGNGFVVIPVRPMPNGMLQIKPQFILSNQFMMQDASICPPDLPYDVAKNRCSSGEFGNLQIIGLPREVRYERDSQGNFRSVFYQNYGNWVKSGCSIASVGGLPAYTSLGQTPANMSRFQIICTDCIPTIYNSSSGIQVSCNCPAF